MLEMSRIKDWDCWCILCQRKCELSSQSWRQSSWRSFSFLIIVQEHGHYLLLRDNCIFLGSCKSCINVHCTDFVDRFCVKLVWKEQQHASCYNFYFLFCSVWLAHPSYRVFISSSVKWSNSGVRKSTMTSSPLRLSVFCSTHRYCMRSLLVHLWSLISHLFFCQQVRSLFLRRFLKTLWS